MPDFDISAWFEKHKPEIPPGGIPADGDDEVWILDNTAFRASPNDPWTAEFVAAYFRHNTDTREKVTAAISALMEAFGLATDDEVTAERIRQRLDPLMRAISSNMTVEVAFDPNHESGSQLHLGPSDGNGISSQILKVPVIDPTTGKSPMPGSGPIDVKVVQPQVESANQTSPTAVLETGRMFLAEDYGWALISDLDDTAKISCVNDHTELIKNTFVNIPEHSPGVPELYRAIRDAVSSEQHPSPFFYISASPYNLYPFLRNFLRDKNYPAGQIILRDMSWHDIHNWYSRHADSFLHTIPVKNYKCDRFRKVASWLPNTTWVCFGDSTQSDPEAYAEFYHELVAMQKETAASPSHQSTVPGPAPATTGTVKSTGQKTGRVARIYIRKVVGVNPELEEKLNQQKRFDDAFDGIPKDVWKVFEHGSEIMDDVVKMKEERLALSKIHAEERARTGGTVPESHPPTSVNPDAVHESLPQKLMDSFRELLNK
ncbi:hypothetical protein M408DRAFT_240332 [Serendipita vermifera MAFF 305830]|uniref:Phosphatidate phosphatase APP1 catalytic domain-containing protein n=1 Tax=Serendipita vermifera MAFF 305830 TaxID=933852 RepID=A0A0C3BK73_SERVB|nr:hypothetical protein M408DRAFT_240332 [Serendipita vermifera MAFF 305830]